METVGTPYSLTNGDLPSSNHPYSNNNNLNNNNSMGPALNSTPGGHMPMGNGNGNTAHACAGCGRGIQDRFLLHALDRYWHTGCLKCSCCQAQLGEIGKSCFTKAGMILCRNDYIRLFGSGGSCMGCGQNIPASEMVYRAQGNVYHIKCFVCVSCRHPLQPGDRYGLLNGSLVCEQDYPKMAKGQGHVPLPARTTHKVC
ncbi:LIM domain transcription factor LMO4.1-like [Littorina saxatilis]|uniref:LIM zinc-binding domain-containing protein n=1 Tax=Littorina saxatilis TaxID=31220 RepID=A0AAN9G577_9CAEN